MLIGYMRCSRDSQVTLLQEDALKKIGCTKIFKDVASGSLDERQGLLDAIAFAREGDSLCVWRLDRLGRSLRQLIETVKELEKANIGFLSITENIDTKTPGGRLIFHIFGALAEFELEVLRSRTKAGLEAVRARGRVGGRPKVINENLKTITDALKFRGKSISEISKEVNVSKSTLYRMLSGNQSL